MLGRGIYGEPRSPFRQLLLSAGVELGDAKALVRERGVEGALSRLYELGVFLTYDEAKGRRPVERAGIDRRLDSEELDNPLRRGSPRVTSVGSRGVLRRSVLDLGDFEHLAAYTSLFATAFDLHERPAVVWRPTPPGRAGLSQLVQLAKLGRAGATWYSQNEPGGENASRKDLAFLRYTLFALRRAGFEVSGPVHVPLEQARTIAARLAEDVRAGTPAEVNAPASAAVRVCLAAAEHGLDISGTFFRVGGEPLTHAKAAVLERAGCRVACHYTMSEVGRIGSACASPDALDDVHVCLDRVATIQPDVKPGLDGRPVRPLHHTTLTLSARTLLLNVDSGDYGVLEARDCGCLLARLGLPLHLHSIRSYEKLTTEGMHFLGPDLLRLIEEVLPARFGGAPTDYQLVEDEEDGLPRVAVVVAPAVGLVDDGEVVGTVLDALGAGAAYRRLMADVWRDGRTLRVVRRRPYSTGAGKVLPLHVSQTRVQSKASCA
jgi:hypothetical protein